MIKTIVNENINELDKATNDFMAEKGKNLPVRTESLVYSEDGEVKFLHKTTIFFDYDFGCNELQNEKKEINGVSYEVEKEVYPVQYPKEEKGALWKRKEGISGNWKEKKISLSEGKANELLDKGYCYTKIGEDDVVVMKNKYKKTNKHPDYIILKSKKGG